MKEYRIGKGWAIFIYIFAPLIIALFVWLLIMPFVFDDTPIESLFFLGPISLAMIGVMAIGLIDTIKGKVIITENTLSIRSTFINRDLLFSEIKGYQINSKYIFVIPNTHLKKQIKISTYIGRADEIITWLAANFTDLHVVNELTEEKEILDNEEYGRNETERSYTLRNAKLTARIINLAGGLVFAWTVFIADPYEYVILASIAVPIISILAILLFKGLIRIDERKGSAYPSVSIAILLPSCGLCLRALSDFTIYDHSNIWMSAALIAIGMSVLAILSTKELKFRKPQEFFTALFILLFFFGYGYGAIVTTNCYYDERIPDIQPAKIINKRISSGKSTTYYFELTPWRDQKENPEYAVSKDLYNKMEIGDTVNVYLKSGLYNIPWVIVNE